MKARLLMLLLGIVLGVTGTIFLPRLLGPLLPAGLRSGGDSVEGTVVRRQRDQERLLLTIDTPQGAALATFTERVAEIDLLVEEGDAVTLGLGAYEPFVNNPQIQAVRKGENNSFAPSPAPEAADSAPSPPAVEPQEDQPAGDETPGEEPDAPAPEAEAELEAWPGDGDAGENG